MTGIRLDYLMTRLAAQPFRRMAPAPAGVPILMYHSISRDDSAAASSYYGITTSPSRFAEHLQFLRDEGYESMTMDDVARLLANGGPRPGDPKRVAITFDDGYADNFTEALPLLRRHGFVATVYLPTAFIGDRRRDFNGRPCLVWDEVRQMQGEGIAFGSHSVQHLELNKLQSTDVQRELQESRDAIEQALGNPVTAFAYPYAFPETDATFVRQLRALLSETGYTSNVTTILGRARGGDDALLLKRLPVNEGDNVPFLSAKLEGAYDWLHTFQVAFKRWKR